MKLLWFTWKDLTHPLAGGAEVVNQELAKRLVRDGHEVKLVVGGYIGSNKTEFHRDGYEIIRLGNRITVYWSAYRYYKKNLIGWADLVIDEVNTIPFFAKLYVKEKHIVLAHMLCRNVWFYELHQPFSTLGYLLEPIYLKLLSRETAITVSDSTKQDLIRMGFKNNKIHLISEGISFKPLINLPDVLNKANQPIILSLGAMRPMKKTLEQIEAFDIAKLQISDLKMKIAGSSDSRYGQAVLRRIDQSPFSNDIEYYGRVSTTRKIELMKKSTLIVVTSVKEGWGLVVTEANSQGTPAIVYDVDGLRDSVINNKTGIVVTENSPSALGAAIANTIKNKSAYKNMRREAWELSKGITFNKSYKDFIRILTNEI